MNEPFVIHVGNFLVEIAQDPKDILGAKKLRFDVFYKEMGASPKASRSTAYDEDAFDDYAQHLIVKDLKANKVVGTYRLLRREGAKKHGRFYTEGEFDIKALCALPSEILEVSRSCVHSAYRTTSVMNLLWRGLAEYILHYDVTHLFGCGSFHGTSLEAVEHALSYLYHYHLLPDAFCPETLPQHYVPMNRLAKDAIDMKRVAKETPPLIRGYTRLGGGVGNGAFVDREFNTIDVCIVVESSCITPKFARYYNARTTQKRQFVSKTK